MDSRIRGNDSNVLFTRFAPESLTIYHSRECGNPTPENPHPRNRGQAFFAAARGARRLADAIASFDLRFTRSTDFLCFLLTRFAFLFMYNLKKSFFSTSHVSDQRFQDAALSFGPGFLFQVTI